MTDIKQFRLPDVGEGLTEADIVSWHVKPGDKVAINQVLVEIETAKAVVELPSPFEGVVAQLLVDEGQTVDVGTPIIAVETSGDRPGEAPETGPAPGERQAVLVGYGVKPGATTRRARRSPATAAATQTRATAPSAPSASTAPATPTTGTPATTATPLSTGTSATTRTPPAPAIPTASSAPAATGAPALAKPPVRKLARDLGVDLSALTGSGPQGSITRDDIQQAARETTSRSGSEVLSSPMGTGRADGPREERIPVRGVRKRVAEAMVASAFTAPHVTEFLDVDVTETTDALRRIRELPEFAGLRVSPLLFVARALVVAVARHPMINSTWDSDAQEIVVRNYVNLGFAAATDRGLIVPNIKDAHALSLPALAAAFASLTATARDGRCSPADLTGGTITITNVGVFGVDAGTPILTPGEAAILAFGRIRDAPWARDGQVVVRKVTTLSLSFDHRIVDGELGSAVLRDIGQMLEDPIRMLAWA